MSFLRRVLHGRFNKIVKVKLWVNEKPTRINNCKTGIHTFLIDSEVRIRRIDTVRGKVRIKVIRKKANFVHKEERKNDHNLGIKI